jgi:hypothetical protein
MKIPETSTLSDFLQSLRQLVEQHREVYGAVVVLFTEDKAHSYGFEIRDGDWSAAMIVIEEYRKMAMHVN